MQVISAGNLKARFSEILKAVQNGEEIAISYGRTKKIVAYLVPESAKKVSGKRPLGFLGKAGTFRVTSDFKMTEDEFLGEQEPIPKKQRF